MYFHGLILPVGRVFVNTRSTGKSAKLLTPDPAQGLGRVRENWLGCLDDIRTYYLQAA